GARAFAPLSLHDALPIGEVLDIIRGAGAEPAGVLVALDREEVGTRARLSATRQLEAELGVPIMSIITLTDLIEHLEEDSEYAQQDRKSTRLNSSHVKISY